MLKEVMRQVHKLLFEIVHKGVLPRGYKRHIASPRDMGLMNALECKEHIYWTTLIIKHFARIDDPQLGSHQLAFENLLTKVFTAFEVPLGEGRSLTRVDIFTQSILVDCGFSIEPEQVLNASPRPSGPVAQLLRELKTAEDKTAILEMEDQTLRVELHTSHAEIGPLKDKLVQQQLANNARVDRVLDMLASTFSHP